MKFTKLALLATLAMSASVGCATIKADGHAKSGYDFTQVGKIGLAQVSFGAHGVPMEFEAASNQIGDLLILELNKRGYTTVERNQIEAVLKEQGFQHSGMTDQDAVKVGKILNLKAIVIANVTEAGQNFQMSAKMIDTQTAEHLWIAEGEGNTNKGLTSMLTTVGGGIVGAGVGTAVGGKGKGTVLGAVGGAFGGMVAGKLLEPSMRDAAKAVITKMVVEFLPRGGN